MVKPRNKGIYCKWESNDLQTALALIKDGKISISGASKRFKILRRTLGDYVNSNRLSKVHAGRKTVLTEGQEGELITRIIRLANVGFPLTPKVLKKCVFQFCSENKIDHPFNNGSAGRNWLRGFLQRHPGIAKRKAQHLNEARAQKLNRFIVSDYFQKLKEVMQKLDIMGKPERIYNVDEKGCRLSLHRQPQVLAKTGSKRVHYRGKEHGENVTIVSCGNALGSIIPPMILFKVKRLKQEWTDNLPHGSAVQMTNKGSMTAAVFVHWLRHFSRYKTAGPCLLIMDGARSHFDHSIVEAAEEHEITLMCLPSNTTHELQPMDKSVFRPFEAYCDEELISYWTRFEDRDMTKQRFGHVFSPVWDKATIPKNVKAGFTACGIYPFNPEVIPDEAFAPSEISQIPQENTPVAGPSNATDMPLSLQPAHITESSSDSSDTLSSTSESDQEGSSEKEEKRMNLSFHGILSTPHRQIKRKNRPAINSRAVVVKTSLFTFSAAEHKHSQKRSTNEDGENNSSLSSVPESVTKYHKNKKSIKTKPGGKDSWYCFLCDKDKVLDMRC